MRLREIEAVQTGEGPSFLQKGARNNRVPNRQTSSVTFSVLLISFNGRKFNSRYMVGSI